MKESQQWKWLQESEKDNLQKDLLPVTCLDQEECQSEQCHLILELQKEESQVKTLLMIKLRPQMILRLE